MRVLGLAFAGTATENRVSMVRFVVETLGFEQVVVPGVEADLFELPDGSRFAVAGKGGMGDTSRSVGFLVESLEDARAALHATGVATDEPACNATHRYIHFRAPDGKLYELIEERKDLHNEH